MIEPFFIEANVDNTNVTAQFSALIEQYHELLSSQDSFYDSVKEDRKFLLNVDREHYQITLGQI
jgi:hypothetical protein